MRIGTSVHALSDFGDDSKPFLETLADAADCGFDSIMLMNFPGKPAMQAGVGPPCSLIDLEASDLGAVREAVREAGLSVAAAYQGCMKVGSDEEAEESATDIKRLIALAHELGTPIALPNAGAAPAPGMPVGEKEGLLQRIARVLASALEGAPPEIRIAIDIHYGGGVESRRRLRALVRACARPTRGNHPQHRPHDHLPPGWLDARARLPRASARGRLERPPARNRPPEATHAVYSVELGTGDSPFERYVEALAPDDGTRQHLITLEHMPLGEKKEALRRSLEHLKRLWSG